MLHTQATIDLAALARNIACVRTRLPKDTRLVLVVKADAYGHGIERVAQTAQAENVDILGATTVEEAATIRAAGVTTPILLLTPILSAEAHAAVSLDLTLPLYELGTARLLDRNARALNTVAHAHVVVDTGMHRFGVSPQLAVTLISQLQALTAVRVDGIYTHFATALATSEAERSFCEEQLASFQRLLDMLADRHLLPPIRHIANSAAFINREDDILAGYLNGVRVGTLLYGYPEVESAWTGAIVPAATLTTAVIAINDLQPGDTVGYGCAHRATQERTIAVLPIGYGTGINPHIAKSGSVWIGGRIAPIVGTIGLDHTMIDVTGIDCAVGCQAEIFGANMRADLLAEAAGIGVCELVVPALQHAGERIYI